MRYDASQIVTRALQALNISLTLDGISEVTATDHVNTVLTQYVARELKTSKPRNPVGRPRTKGNKDARSTIQERK